MTTAKNPIIPGYSPDPSICRVGEDYYLVNSTFSFFPGLPIYHSRDLAHWELIGNVMTRPSQLPLEGCRHSEGLFAPTIRWHNGVFYVICTNISGGGNFIVTAADPRGEWSEPYWLDKDAIGIDPSLFFDDDGSCWYCGTRERSEGAKYYGDNEIYLRRVDLDKMELVGETYIIWHSAMRDAVWPEGPHIYKRNGFYYVMIAEGGTSVNHAVTIARSTTLTSGYEGFRNNPILTHRHLGNDCGIINVGHGDLVDAVDGSWYMVMLASRTQRGVCPLGRETFLARVRWDEDWPVVNPGIGKLEDTVNITLEPKPVFGEGGVFSFEGETLSPEFMSLRAPIGERASLTAKRGCLRLYASKESIRDEASPSFLCVRPRSLDFTCSAAFRLYADAECEAGIVVMQSNYYSLRLVRRHIPNGQDFIDAVFMRDGVEQSVGSIPFDGDICVMKIVFSKLYASLICNGTLVADCIDCDCLSTEKAGGFVGNTVGLYIRSDKAFATNGETAPYIDCSSLYVL